MKRGRLFGVSGEIGQMVEWLNSEMIEIAPVK